MLSARPGVVAALLALVGVLAPAAALVLLTALVAAPAALLAPVLATLLVAAALVLLARDLGGGSRRPAKRGADLQCLDLERADRVARLVEAVLVVVLGDVGPDLGHADLRGDARSRLQRLSDILGHVAPDGDLCDEGLDLLAVVLLGTAIVDADPEVADRDTVRGEAQFRVTQEISCDVKNRLECHGSLFSLIVIDDAMRASREGLLGGGDCSTSPLHVALHYLPLHGFISLDSSCLIAVLRA